MKHILALIILTVGSSFVAGAVWADDDYDNHAYSSYGYKGDNDYSNVLYTYARVVDAEPVYRRVSLPAQKHCWDEEITSQRDAAVPRESFPAHAVLGGIIGGVIGNQIGAGKGKDAATIAGALTGIAIGHDAHRKSYRQPGIQRVAKRRCNVFHEYRSRKEVTGYRVTYRYRGRDYHTRTQYRPDSRIRIAVSVYPVE